MQTKGGMTALATANANNVGRNPKVCSLTHAEARGLKVVDRSVDLPPGENEGQKCFAGNPLDVERSTRQFVILFAFYPK